jgi:rhodanese-related sulfurtransferase
MAAWAQAGLAADHVGLVSAEELFNRISGDQQIALVDVRAAGEYSKYHIKGSVHIPAPDLRSRYRELRPDLPVYLLCSTGNRSSIGASVLKQKGFTKVHNVAGGMTGYSAAGYAPECPVCFTPHGPRFSGADNA